MTIAGNYLVLDLGVHTDWALILEGNMTTPKQGVGETLFIGQLAMKNRRQCGQKSPDFILQTSQIFCKLANCRKLECCKINKLRQFEVCSDFVCNKLCKLPAKPAPMRPVGHFSSLYGESYPYRITSASLTPVLRLVLLGRFVFGCFVFFIGDVNDISGRMS